MVTSLKLLRLGWFIRKPLRTGTGLVQFNWLVLHCSRVGTVGLFGSGWVELVWVGLGWLGWGEVGWGEVRVGWVR